MKNFKPKAWLIPQPVLIIGTYDADGTPNAITPHGAVNGTLPKS